MLVEVIDELTGILVPIFICVVLPVTCVWMVVRKFINADNRRSEVIIEAIKANSGIDADKLAEAMAKPRKTALEVLNKRLLVGCVSTLLGVAALICGVFFYCTDPYLHIHNMMFILAGLFLAVGIGYLIVYRVTRGQVMDACAKKDDTAAE